MATRKPTGAADSISVIQVQTGSLTVAIVGNSPLILNRLNEKVKHELLLPAARKNAADKASTLKHNPLEEFRSAPERIEDDKAPTLLAIPATALKSAMRTAALDLPGAKKSQIGRLTYVEGAFLGIYGVPQVFTTTVRSADINKTPDIRTRCIVPKWAAIATITYVRPIMREQSIANLVAAAGITAGIGDFRPEKGAGDYGRFRVADGTDPELVRLMKEGGRAAQIKAMSDPVAYDANTEELLAWFDVEVKRRGFKVAA